MSNPYHLPVSPAPGISGGYYDQQQDWTGAQLGNAGANNEEMSVMDDDDEDDDEEDMDDELYDDRQQQRKGSKAAAPSTAPAAAAGEKKKQTRGSKACTVCRKLKMRCQPGPQGASPCKRCESSGRGHECVFEESQRGRRTNRKTDILSKSIKRVEEQLSTVLQAIGQGVVPANVAALPSTSTSNMFRQQADNAVHNLMSLTNRQYHPVPATAQPRFTPALPSVPQRSPLSLQSAAGGQPPSQPGMTNGVPGQHQAVAESLDSMFFKDPSHKGSSSASSNPSKRGETEENPRLHSLPDNAINPLGLLAEASLQNTRKRPVSIMEALERGPDGADSAADSKRQKLGVANNSYFQPGPMNIMPLRKIVIEQRMPPEILVDKVVTVEEVVELFAIFFAHCHRHTPFLDPELHTPTTTGSRSPFLFTCICTVAARYYTKRTDDLYKKCLKSAKKAAFDVMAKGFKSIEICQGFLLLANWNQPAERFEEERSYQFSGIAFRMAHDLNLHRKTTATLPEDASEEARISYQRELLNRERTWIFCFIYDHGLSNQMGKPYSIPKEDYIIRNAATHWWQSPGTIATDVGLCAILEAIRIVARCSDFLFSDASTPSGLLTNLNWQPVMDAFIAQLDAWAATWAGRFIGNMSEADMNMRNHLRNFYYSYYRLFLRSFAVQDLLNRRDTLDLPTYCVQCFEDAATIIRIAKNELLPVGALRYCQDSMFVYMSYAAVFLLKLVSPVFSSIINENLAMSLVEDMAKAFEECAVDETHTPALYAHFIRALLDNKRNGPRTAPSSRANTRPSSPNPSGAATQQHVVNGGDDDPSSITEDTFIEPRLAANSSSAQHGSSAAASESTAPGTAFDSAAMDSMLSTGGFWDNMLMPGFGGPLVNLAGGTGTMLSNGGDPWSITPLHSRPGSPAPPTHNFFSSFDGAQSES